MAKILQEEENLEFLSRTQLFFKEGGEVAADRFGEGAIFLEFVGNRGGTHRPLQ